MPVVVADLLADLLDGTQITMSPDQIREDIDGAGRVFVCKGNLPQGASIRGAKAIVVDGDVVGHPNTLAEIFCKQTVVVLGHLDRVHVRADQLVVSKSVRNSMASVVKSVEIGEDLHNSHIDLGARPDDLDALLERFASLQALLPQHEILAQKVEAERRSLSRLLQVTGVVFNLNIGKIIQQTGDGLSVDLTTFYEAVQGRSVAEVDKALRQFFAKAVLGLLTRLNKDYIASGRGHQDRFKKVIRKLQDLVFKCREYDKFVDQNHAETAQVEALCAQYNVNLPQLHVQGVMTPSVEVGIRGVESRSEDDIAPRHFRFELEEGQRKGTDEARGFRGDRLTEMVVVNKHAMSGLMVKVSNNQIEWESRAIV